MHIFTSENTGISTAKAPVDDRSDVERNFTSPVVHEKARDRDFLRIRIAFDERTKTHTQSI